MAISANASTRNDDWYYDDETREENRREEKRAEEDGRDEARYVADAIALTAVVGNVIRNTRRSRT